MSSVTGQINIARLRLSTAAKAIKLEESGMVRRGKSVTQMYREYFGLPRSANRQMILERIQAEIQGLDTKLLIEGLEGGAQ